MIQKDMKNWDTLMDGDFIWVKVNTTNQFLDGMDTLKMVKLLELQKVKNILREYVYIYVIREAENHPLLLRFYLLSKGPVPFTVFNSLF